MLLPQGHMASSLNCFISTSNPISHVTTLPHLSFCTLVEVFLVYYFSSHACLSSSKAYSCWLKISWSVYGGHVINRIRLQIEGCGCQHGVLLGPNYLARACEK
jgi:hypothetical protein